MELPMWSRKRPLHNGYVREPPHKKRDLSSFHFYPANHTNGATQYNKVQTSCGRPCTSETNRIFFKQLSSWSDTESSVKRVLELFSSRKPTGDVSLSGRVNRKFLEFHRDITEEFGAEDKQHSWAVIEKRDEVVICGPYYPNYKRGVHSEDVIIRQTQELLDSGESSGDWEVFVFSMNSPCLARNTAPCMINLVQKACEWWSVYGVTTHIGFARCWGFRGTKETLFRDIDYRHVDCIDQTQGREEYVKAANARTDLTPLSENVTSAVKHLLRSENSSFLLAQGQDWKSYFKRMQSVFEGQPQDNKNVLSAAIGGAQALLSEKIGSFKEHLQNGKDLSLDCACGIQASDDVRKEIRAAFEQCWREMVQDKYAEFIRGKLTEDFNRCVIQLFIGDVAKFTEDFLHVGSVRFSEEDGVQKLNTLT